MLHAQPVETEQECCVLTPFISVKETPAFFLRRLIHLKGNTTYFEVANTFKGEQKYFEKANSFKGEQKQESTKSPFNRNRLENRHIDLLIGIEWKIDT